MTAHTATQVDWTDRADVVVVGGGGAGMAAALSAAETAPEGDVVLLQKIDELGGSTTISIGYFSAAGTRMQAEQGIEDSPDRHYHDLQKLLELYDRTDGKGPNYFFDFQGDLEEKDNKALRRMLLENAGDTHDWLCDFGCEYAGPYGEAPHGKPRCHQIMPDTEAYRDVLGDAIDDLGVQVRFETTAEELVTDDGEVIGVLATDATGEAHAIRAAGGVVLATGGYINDFDLREQYTTVADAPPVNEHNTGDGHRMARAVGAELVNMDMQWLRLAIGAPYYTFPEIASLVEDGAVLVDSNGERFTNELNEYDQLFREVVHLDDQECYLVFDDRIAGRYTEWPHFLSIWGQDGKQWGYMDEYEETDVLATADSAASLGESVGFDPGAFETTVETANEGVFDEVTGQHIDEFGRREGPRLTDPPYHAVGPIQPFSLLTDGGVKVDTSLRALEADGTPVPGLYAAGVTAGDVFLFGHGHHHAWIFTTGRRAGAAAARRV